MNLDDSLADLFEQYKDEVRETIGILDTELVAIEQDASNSEVIFSIFRHLHSLKGASKMFNVDNIGHIAHKLEDLMQVIDKDNSILAAHPTIIELLFQGNDIFRDIINRLEDDIGFVNLTNEHAQFIESINRQMAFLERKDGGLIEAARTLLDELDPVIMALEDSETEGLRRAVKSLSNHISLLTAGDGSKVIHYSYHGADLTDNIVDYESGLAKFKTGSHTPEDVAAFFRNTEEMIGILMEVAEEDVMGILGELSDGLEMYREKNLEIDLIVIEFLGMVLDDLKGRLQAEAGTVETASVVESGVSAPKTESTAKTSTQVKTIRVDEKKIDLFLDSVGQLITQSEILNHLQFSFRQAGINPALVRDFASVNRSISNDIVLLQKSIMEVRQVEMDNILKKFPRLVRDLSMKMGKEAVLEIQGERVPIDKSLLDDVEQAMIHIVRNSIDHGLETPAERTEAGKDPRGRISIRVFQEETSILVEIADDGRGIDPAAVRAKALERGMIDREQFENLADRDVLQLVFNSGLTTKAEATDISGRGVGLDVVLSNIRKWNGEVDLESEPGRGVTMRLRIPVTNTLLTKEAILLKLGEGTYCLPLESVVEIVTVPTDQLHRHKGRTVFQHRKQVVSVVDLKGLLGLPADDRPSRGVSTCVILRGRIDNRRAIAADEIVGQQKIVIKDFDLAAFRRLPYFQGLTLMGDGRVVLILDAERIVE